MKYDKSIGAWNGAHKDLIGLRFGRLLVVKRLGSQKGHSLFECKCDCGNVVRKTAPQLKTTKRVFENSCGCVSTLSRTKDIAGKRFGKLVVVGRAGNYVTDHKTIAQWKCKCQLPTTEVVGLPANGA